MKKFTILAELASNVEPVIDQNVNSTARVFQKRINEGRVLTNDSEFAIVSPHNAYNLSVDRPQKCLRMAVSGGAMHRNVVRISTTSRNAKSDSCNKSIAPLSGYTDLIDNAQRDFLPVWCIAGALFKN